jgi:hypothetical protein
MVIKVRAFLVVFIIAATFLFGCGKQKKAEAPGGGETSRSKEPAAAEFNTLRIVFDGLVAFVPEMVSGQQKVWVVLPKADHQKLIMVPSGAHPQGPGPRGHFLPLHHAFIKVMPQYVFKDLGSGDGRTPIFLSLTAKEPQNPEPDEATYVGHDILFEPPIEDGSVQISGFQNVPELGHLGDNNEDLHHEKICTGCLSPVPLPELLRGRVASRLHLLSGDLAANNLVPTDVRFAKYVAGTKTPTGKDPMKLAQTVVATVRYPRGPLTLKLQSLADAADVHSVTLIADANNSVTIEVVNLPADAALGRIESTKEMNSKDIEHFSLFYIISNNKDTPPYIFPTTDTQFGGQPYCGVAQAKP